MLDRARGKARQAMRRRIARAFHEARRQLEAIHPNEPEERAAVSAVLEVITREQSTLATQDEPEPTNPAEQIRELSRRVAELEDALSARDEFISTVGHELRNPLSPIFFQVEHLLSIVRNTPQGVVATASLLPRLETFSQRLQRFLTTLNRITDVSRINAGKVDLALEEVDLGDLVRDVADGMEREVAAACVALSIRVEERIVGRWDRMRLEQISHNLLSNALRYGMGAPVEISVERDGDEALLRVRDQGPGIAEEDQVRIFQRFERASGGRRTGGFGIGLWVVKKLCVAMGGDVEVESRVGEGSTFTVRLPLEGRKTA